MKKLFTILSLLFSVVAFTQTSQISQVADVTAMQNYTGSSGVLIIKDAATGGLVRLCPECGTADGSIIFSGASSRKWRRVYTATNAVRFVGTELRFGGTGIENTNVDWGAFSVTHTFNGLVNSGMLLSSNSTAVLGGSAILNITATGAVVATSGTNYGVFIQNVRTGSGITSTGLYSEAPGTGITARSGGIAVSAVATGGGSGVIGQSSAGLGVWGVSTSGSGLSSNSSTGLAMNFAVTGLVTTNSRGQFGAWTVQTAGTAANNFGGFVDLNVETDGAITPGTTGNAGQMYWWLYDAAQTTYKGAWGIGTSNNGSASTTIRFDVGTGGGNVRVLTPGKGLALTSPNGTIYYATISDGGVLSSWSTTAP